MNFEILKKEDIDDHVCLQHIMRPNPSGRSLGYMSLDPTITIPIKDLDNAESESPLYTLEVEQSIPSFRNSHLNNGSTTGYVVWGASKLFAEWLLSKKLNPFYDELFDRKNAEVVELGSGCAGILASSVGKHVKRWICSDHGGIIALLSRNVGISENGAKTDDNSSTKRKDKAKNKHCIKNKKKSSKCIDHVTQVCVVEYDWELSDKSVILDQLENEYPNFILSCDTIYNDYLTTFLIESIKELCDKHTKIIICLQFRETGLLEWFLHEGFKNGFKIWYLNEYGMFGSRLIEGYGVYLLQLDDVIN